MEIEVSKPILRFPEFTGGWKRKRLGEVADISKLAGFEYTKHVIYSNSGKIIALRALNIKKNSLNLSEIKFIDGSDFSKLKRSKLYVGDLMFTYIGANIGDVALIPENDRFYLAPNVSRIRSNKDVLNHFYLLQYFNIPSFLKKEINKYIASSSQPALSMESIRQFRIYLPSILEQKKIASFLSSFDRRINLLEQKKEQLEEYKKGVMQKLFSQQIRFKNEKGKCYPDWKEKKLGDVGEIVGGGTPETTETDYWEGNIQWFTPTELKKKYVDRSHRTITSLGLKKSSAKLLPKGTVLFSSRATVGDVSIACSECSTNQGFQSVIVNEENVNEFLYYWIKENKREFLKRASGSTFLEISKNEIRKIKILLPCFEEQLRVANFLSSIDNMIQHTTTQIEKSKEYKKGLLQKMFV